MPRFWLSYDLGIEGDYAPLYRWLDNVSAKDCGDSLATFLSDKTREQIGTELIKW
jgi:hypothetical protein